LNDLIVNNAGGNDYPFPDGVKGERDVAGTTFTINANSAPTAVGVNDNDRSFNDGDTSQVLAQGTTLNGVSESAGKRFTPEYSYSIQDSSGNVINVLEPHIDTPDNRLRHTD